MTTARHAPIRYLRWLHRYIATNGYAPSIRDVCASFGYASTGSARYHLAKLEAAGWIVRDSGRARAVRITKRGVAALREAGE